MLKRVRRTIGLLTVGASIIGCHITGKDPEPFNPRLAQEIARSRAGEFEQRPIRPLPTTLESPYLEPATNPATARTPRFPPATGPSLESGPTMRMSLREIVQRAIANNKDVAVAGYQPAIDETRVVEAASRFDPTFFTNLTYSDQTTLSPSQQNVSIQPGQAFVFRSWSLETGIKQDLETGGQLQLKYNPTYTKESLPSGSLTKLNPNPFWTSDPALQLTQPLLRDFGYGVNQARITIARNNQLISLLDFRDQIETTLLGKNGKEGIEDTYWRLAQAEGEVAISDQLVSETLSTAELLRKRLGQDVTRVQLSQTNSFLETRRANLLRARARVRDASDALKKLMNDPEIPVTSPVVILPASVPAEEQIRMNLEDQINTAMENRVELGQQQLRIDSANIASQVGKNNLLPQLNVVGSVGVEGIAGDYWDSVKNEADFDHVSWSVGLQFELPLGNRQARAIWKRTLLQRQQAIAQYQALVEQVSLDVKQALREVETSYEEIYAARKARFAAADTVRAIEERERGGEALTYNFVDLKLTTQQRYAEAQQAEVQAIASYNIALSALERAKGTLLRYNNVIMQEAPLQKY